MFHMSEVFKICRETCLEDGQDLPKVGLDRPDVNWILGGLVSGKHCRKGPGLNRIATRQLYCLVFLIQIFYTGSFCLPSSRASPMTLSPDGQPSTLEKESGTVQHTSTTGVSEGSKPTA